MFEKNLQYINNETLKNKLQRVSEIDSRIGMSYGVTPSQDYVLLKNEMPLDDINNPREAIRKHLKQTITTAMRPTDIIITFGIGLCYLLDETFNAYPSKIYVYEPDLELLHFVLHNVDISEHLASGRVFIFNDLNELVDKVSTTYLTRDKIEIVYLQNYAIVKNKEMISLTQKVYDACKSKIVDISTITRYSQSWLDNILTNIASVNNKSAYLLSQLENKFIGQTSLIAGAGPSLNDNIEYIQANRNKLVIFAVNKAVKYLTLNGIIPDFVVCLDAANIEKTLDIPEQNISSMNCIMDIRADKSLFNKNFKKIFLNFSDTDIVVTKLAKFNNDIKIYESGGTAAIMALISAIKLGFSKIILAGIDLAFKDNTIYATGETLTRLSPERIVVDNVHKKLVQVKSVNGSLVNTRDDYQAFIHHFEVLLNQLNYHEVYNVSSFGANIEGVKNVSFNEIRLIGESNTHSLKDVQEFKFSVNDFIQDEFFNINGIISELSKGVFSPLLVQSMIKSVLIYQYMQAEILDVLQRNFEQELAERFITSSKTAIKTVVDILQKTKLI